jgi:hypothetical protein
MGDVDLDKDMRLARRGPELLKDSTKGYTLITAKWQCISYVTDKQTKPDRILARE